MIASKIEVKGLIEPHFHSTLDACEYKINTLSPESLLTHNRFDLAFKLYYLDGLTNDDEFSKRIYKEHISAFTFGGFTEPGNKNKNSIENFEVSFKDTYENIKVNGFDRSNTLVPLSQCGIIVNGAHRVACAIHLNQKVSCVSLAVEEQVYDYKFFYSRNVPTEMLDAAATKFIEYASNVHVALLWPTAVGHNEKLEDIIPNIVYRKDITVNKNGAHNLLSQIYYGEEWLGNVENNFLGAVGKLVECFKSFDPIRVIAFQATSLEEVLIVKEKIRKLFDVGKHSIHITDTKEEAIRTSRLVFNSNSIHFINYAKPNKYISTHNKINDFKFFIKKNKLNSKSLLIDSSIILSVYGLREAKDTDFFCDDNSKLSYSIDGIDTHDEELVHYDKSKREMIHNQRYYFYFNDIKFISFDLLYKMKKRRAEEKDLNDCKIMEAMIESNRIKGALSKLNQHIFYTKNKLKNSIIQSLKKYGLYEIVRMVYRIVKGGN